MENIPAKKTDIACYAHIFINLITSSKCSVSDSAIRENQDVTMSQWLYFLVMTQ